MSKNGNFGSEKCEICWANFDKLQIATKMLIFCLQGSQQAESLGEKSIGSHHDNFVKTIIVGIQLAEKLSYRVR